jgi:flagellar biosynthesis GTPase FlhF
MSIRAIPRTAIGGSIKAVRLPLDIVVSLLPGNGAGAGPSAALALDRIEAHVRDFAGLALGDEVLREDAARRRVAADERERALRLRAAAARRAKQADERLADTGEEAEEQREEAAERARRQRADADQLRRQRARDAARVERKRRAASETARSKADEAIEEVATAARLEQLEREAAVLDEQADALTAEAEAQRLQDEATRKKAARNSG